MSVRTIAANGKPVSTKVLASSSGSTSWQSPVNYVDPLTGQRYEAPTLQDLLQTLDPQNGGPDLLDHASMRKLGGSPKGNDDGQWDRLIVHLDGYETTEDIDRARTVILDTLRNPNISYQVNPGPDRNGKPRPLSTKTMMGARAVVAHEIHRDDQRGPHFMAYVHTVARSADGTFTAKSSFTNDQARAAFMAQINANLDAAGLKPVEWKGVDERPENVFQRTAQVDAATSDKFREALAEGTVPDLPEAEELPEVDPSVRREQLRLAAKEAATNAATLHARALQEAHKAKTYDTAIRALEAEEQHLARIGALTTRLQEAVTNAAEAEAQHAATVAEQATVIEATQAKASELSEQLESTTATLAETTAMLESTEAELSQVKASLATVTSAKNELEKQLEDTSAQLRGVTDELAIATQNIDQLETRQAELSRALDTERLERKNETAAHEAEISELRGELSSEKKAREKAETQLEKTRSDLADERTAHNAVKSELKAETKRADTAEKAAAKAQDELAALREQLATALAQSKAQAADLAREREARAQAEQAARTAMAAAATAEAQRDARPTQAQLQEAMAATAKAEAQRDALAERVEQLLKPQAPTPGNDNSGPKA